MADDSQDQSQKTEEPTQRRLEEARKKGNIPISRELNHWFILLGVSMIVMMLVPQTCQDLTHIMRTFLEFPHALPVEDKPLGHLLSKTLRQVIAVLLWPFSLLLAFALAAGFIQTGFNFSLSSLKPKMDKISPRAGLKRLFSKKSVMEFIKGVAKITVIAVISSMVLMPEIGKIGLLVGLEGEPLLAKIHQLVIVLVISVFCVMSFVAALDYFFERLEYMKNLRMSKQELKEEFKETEGDPVVRGRFRQLRADRARRRMMAAVPSATVVITNPTHYAVALLFDLDTMEVPKVVAKGADYVAQNMRKVATENGVPLVENPPLARALFDTVDLEEDIPYEHYQAVAEVIRFILRQDKRR
jgi:flagellar biosynthetic protein FlhB